MATDKSVAYALVDKETDLIRMDAISALAIFDDESSAYSAKGINDEVYIRSCRIVDSDIAEKIALLKAKIAETGLLAIKSISQLHDRLDRIHKLAIEAGESSLVMDRMHAMEKIAKLSERKTDDSEQTAH